MNKNDFFKKLLFFILVSLTVIVGVATLIFTTTKSSTITFNDSSNLIISTKDSWTKTSDTSAYITIQENTNETLLFKYNSNYDYSEVYLGDTLIYTTVDDELDTCNYIHWISFNTTSSHKITIKTQNKEDLDAICHCESVIGSYNTVIVQFVFESIWFILFIAFCIIAFFALAFINIYYRFINKASSFNANYLALVVACAAIYSLTDSQILSVLGKDYPIFSVLNIIAVTLIAPYTLKFISAFLTNQYKLVNYFSVIGYVLLCIFFALYSFDVIRIFEFLIVDHILILVCASIIIYLTIKEYIQHKYHTLLVIIVGLGIVSISCIISIITYYTMSSGVYILTFILTLFIYIITLIIVLISVINEHGRKLQFESKESLEKANKAIDELNNIKSNIVEGLNKNVKGPINEIYGYTNLAIKNKDDNLKYLDIVKQNTRILDNVVDDITDIFKEENRVLLGNTRSDILAYFNVLSSNIQTICKRNHINFISDLINSTHRFIILDENNMDKVIMHLVGNALKYTNESNNISLIIRESNCEKEGFIHLTFSINDDGLGMNKDFISHAFDTFSKENIINKKPVKNSGLELALAKKIINELGGEISIDSANEKGTSIHVDIDVEIADEQIDLSKYSYLADKKILLIDCDYQNCEIIKSYLTDINCKVDILNDTGSANELLIGTNYNPYDAMILELDMPNISGFELVKTIRNFGYARVAYMPVIAMSLNNKTEVLNEALESGFNDCLFKPVDPNELYEKLKKHIN